MNVFIEIIKTLFIGIRGGFDIVLHLLPIYEQLSSVKEQLIAAAIGVPTILVSIAFFIPTLLKIFKHIFL